MLLDEVPLALTFDDVLLQPGHSTILPRDANVGTRLCRDLALNVPFLSSAMDTVTESSMGIAMARLGGIGILHKNLSVAAQAREVRRVKKAMTGMILDPITLSPTQSLRVARNLMREHGINGLPILDGEKVVGILTNRDLRYERNLDKAVGDAMTREGLVTCAPGTDLEAARAAS